MLTWLTKGKWGVSQLLTISDNEGRGGQPIAGNQWQRGERGPDPSKYGSQNKWAVPNSNPLNKYQI